MTNGFGCSGFYHVVEYLIVLGLTECFCDLQQTTMTQSPAVSRSGRPVFLASVLSDKDPGISLLVVHSFIFGNGELSFSTDLRNIFYSDFYLLFPRLIHSSDYLWSTSYMPSAMRMPGI